MKKSRTMKQVVQKATWGNLARHLLAFIIASMSVGYLITAVPAILELFENPSLSGITGLLGFFFGMGLFMGAFYLLLSGPFVFVGIGVGLWFDLRQWWFCSLWGCLSALATARLFHDRSQNLDAPFYLMVAQAGFLAGIIYWLIAVRRTSATAG